MRTHDVLDTAGGSPTTVHLGQALRAGDLATLLATAVSVSAGTLDGILASIHVGDRGTLVAYRDDVAGCPS